MISRVLATALVLGVLGSGLGCGKKDPNAKPDALGANPAMAPLDYLAAQGKAKKFAEKTINMVEIQSAIQKFQAMEDRYPRNFTELVQQHYLGAMPEAPTGMRFVYNPSTGLAQLVPASQAPDAVPQAVAPASPGRPPAGPNTVHAPSGARIRIPSPQQTVPE